jgi:hypothetical protein
MSGWAKKDPKKEQKKELARSLKKMKSYKDISSRPESSSGQHISANFNTKMLFDMTEEKRQRLIDEARARKQIESAAAEIHPDAIAVAI